MLRLRSQADTEAWAQFETRYGPLILSYALKRGLQFSDAEDVRQMVLLGVSRSFPNFSYDATRGRFRSYLGTSVRNAISRLASRHTPDSNGLPLDETTDSPDASGAPADALWEQQWMKHHYRLAMGTLRAAADPSSVRIIEGFLSGMSTDAIARELGLTQQTVRKAKQRMKQRLTEIIAKQLADEELGPHPHDA